MASFSFLGCFREGQWRAFRRFMLEERRDAASRINMIFKELDRIGDVRIMYTSEADPENPANTVLNEKRRGIMVDGETSVGKLVAAYTAMGGNPFDISMFLIPDSAFAEVIEGEQGIELIPTQPGSGLLYMDPIQYNFSSSAQEGASILKYDPKRTDGLSPTGDRRDADIIQRARQAITKEMRYKRWDLEARIIKLMDLREQLLEEVSDIVWASGPSQTLPATYQEDFFGLPNVAARIAYRFDAIFRIPETDGDVPLTTEVNLPNLSKHKNLMTDNEDGQEDWYGG